MAAWVGSEKELGDLDTYTDRAQLDGLGVAIVVDDDAEEDSGSADAGFDQDGLTTFLGQVGRHRVLSAAEERRLAAVISEGGLARQWLESGRAPASAEADEPYESIRGTGGGSIQVALAVLRNLQAAIGAEGAHA